MNDLSRKGTLKIVDYFEEEDLEIEKKKQPNYTSTVSDHEVNFLLSQYGEYFFYHIIYFLLLGPFIGLFIICIPKARFLFYNMEFVRLNSIAVTQAFYWLITMFIIIGFALQYQEINSTGVFDAPLLKTIITSIILRTTSIAGKYATYSKDLITRYRTEYINKDVIFTEFMLVGWLKQGGDIVFAEIKHCLTRLEIDKSTFSLSFMAKVSSSVESGLVGISEERGDNTGKNLSLDYRFNQKDFRYFKGDQIFELLVKLFNEKLKIPLRMAIGFRSEERRVGKEC